MVNFYKEFSIPTDFTVEEIQQHLVKERKKWSLRLNAAELNRRQNAEQKISLLDQAVKVFADEYSKEKYDSELKKKGEDNQNVSETFEKSINANEEVDAVLMQIDNIYNTGNSSAAIELCNQAITARIRHPKVYQYLINSYEEMECYDQAFATAKTAMSLFPEEINFRFIGARLLALRYNKCEEAQQLLSDILKERPDASGAIALQNEIDLRTGNKEKADREIDNYLKEHPDNTDYKHIVAYAYIRYADTFLTTSNNGGNYINSKGEYNQCLAARKRAYEISPDEVTKEYYDAMVQYGKIKFDTSLLGGIAIAIIAGFLFVESSLIIALISWASGIWMGYSAFEPKWQIDREYFTGERKIANTIAYILTSIVRTIWRIFWGFLSGLFGAFGSN